MNWDETRNKQFVRALLALNTPAEMRSFLRDLMTEGEIEDMAKRLETARMLSENATYPAVQEATGFSTTTIARVSKWLQEGEGGYATVLNRLHHAHTTASGGRGLR
jgi:TrpR-related protein YerC/YecD